MLYNCINVSCKNLFESEDAKYCPECGWLVAPEDIGEEILRTKSRCLFAYLCQVTGEFYHRDCETGASSRCHRLIDSLLRSKAPIPDDILPQGYRATDVGMRAAVREVLDRRMKKS